MPAVCAGSHRAASVTHHRRRPARARHRSAHPHRHLQPVRGRQVLLHHDGCVRRSRRPASIRSLIVTRPSWQPRSGT